jgi:hypothetical protein
LGAVCVAGCVESSRAQGTLSATATLTETGTAGSEFEYSLLLDNTGTVPIDALWYGWTQGSFNLPSGPTGIAGPSGWTGTADGDSIQFKDGSGTAANAIAPGAFGTFTFDSTSSLSQMTTGTHDGDPTGESVAYALPSEFGEQSQAGQASSPFTPTAVPEPSAFGLMITGLAGISVWLATRRSIA